MDNKDKDEGLDAIIKEYKDLEELSCENLIKWEGELGDHLDLIELYSVIKNDVFLGNTGTVIGQDVRGYLIGKEIEAQKKIRDIIKTDELTGLANDKGYNMGMRRCINRIEREQYLDSNKYIAFLFIDINDFKEEANDKYNHKFGNDILRYVADAIKGHTKITDLKARYSGDEFIIVLDPFDVEDSNKYLMDLTNETNKHIQKMINRDHPGKEAAITVSIGMSLYGKDALNKKELEHHSDDAMYHAKNNPVETEVGTLNFHIYDPNISYIQKKNRKGRVSSANDTK
ncbi:MAG: GGDEF domain-containing protein [Nanoarchaeota archaeon]|nr:GGDEF domain-containing protein [Nanoarchaeota archaeon]